MLFVTGVVSFSGEVVSVAVLLEFVVSSFVLSAVEGSFSFVSVEGVVASSCVGFSSVLFGLISSGELVSA